MAKRPPFPPEVLSADGDKFFDLLNEAEDVSVIVVGVGYIDACVVSLLHKRLRQSHVSDLLLDAKGPLGAFWARSSLAYALGLIDKAMYADLTLFAELRNEVAHHHFAFDFSTAAVVDRCAKLTYASKLENGNSGEPLLAEEWLHSSRNRFTLSAVMIATRLLLTALGTQHAASEV